MFPGASGQRKVRVLIMVHSKRCMAAAIIAAVENIRDEEGTDEVDFRIAMLHGRAIEAADDYLATGLTECRCPTV